MLLEDLLAEGEPKLFTLDPELFGQGGIPAVENSYSTCAMRWNKFDFLKINLNTVQLKKNMKTMLYRKVAFRIKTSGLK